MSESNARVETTWSGPEIKPVPAWYFDIVPVVWLETHPGIYLLAPQPSSPVRARDLRLSDPPSLANNAEFPYFSRLPAEIRCQIWELALPGPRIVKVRSYAKAIWRGPPYFNVQQNRNGKNVGECIYSLFRSPSKPPTILFVNQESRAEARKHYHENTINLLLASIIHSFLQQSGSISSRTHCTSNLPGGGVITASSAFSTLCKNMSDT
jgi:hypothetical protein